MPNYYDISEAAAKRAKQANSFSDYREGSATAGYQSMVDEATRIAEAQKERVDPMYHEKIDHLLDLYSRKMAGNLNEGYSIEARVPSILITGGSNFPVGKKEKQNAARRRNMEESAHWGITMPVFIDNAESVTRLAHMGAQVIRLVVSAADAALRMENDGQQKEGAA